MVRVSELIKKREAVNLADNKPHILEFLEAEPREVVTRMGTREVINVLEGGEEKSLWLSTVGLRVIIENLHQKYQNLKGKKIKIRRLEKRVGRLYDYEFEEIS
jgi:hypothetical protein